MAIINPYLTFNGNCEEAFNFYKKVFGGEFSYLGRFNEMPPSEEGEEIPESEGNKIMHISLPMSKETSLMGSDSSDAYGQATVIGNNFSISINAESKEEADRLYKELSDGGKQTMPMNTTFWGSYFGMLTDRFSVQWMISYDARSANN
ncbi:MAG: VOC family protein [Taibaiella sp.]|nr:VOC family protein [Taibaiella sp.]